MTDAQFQELMLVLREILNVFRPNKLVTKSAMDEDFEQFWQEYPKKVGKGGAEACWKRLKPDRPLFARIIEALKVQKKSSKWREDGGKYIPNPATWLNQKRWEDDLSTTVQANLPPVMMKKTETRPDGEPPPKEVAETLSRLLGKEMNFPS